MHVFNPSIDRYDVRGAARVFASLWPVPNITRAVAENLAASVRTAHEASDSCWSVTLKGHVVRLNVGQVETITASADAIRFLVCLPLMSDDPRFPVDASRNPVYFATPVPSAVCSVAPRNLSDLPVSIRSAHVAFIEAAAAFKRSSPFKRSYSPSVLDHVESFLNAELPRPSYATEGIDAHAILPLAEEVDDSEPLVEGARYQVTIDAFERDPRARRRCIAAHGTSCVVCGMSFGNVYGPMAAGLIHVHHLRLLSDVGESHEVDPINDLRPVCPNCHAVLHRRKPPYGIEELRAMIVRRDKEKFE